MGLKPIPLSPNKFSKIQARPAGSTQINKAHVWFHQHRWCTCERRADQRPDMLFMWGTHFLSSSAVCLTKSLCTDSTFRSGDHKRVQIILVHFKWYKEKTFSSYLQCNFICHVYRLRWTRSQKNKRKAII